MTLSVAIAGAMLGWMALALQIVLSLHSTLAQGGTVLDGVWRYLGYFTIIANLFAATVLTLAALGRGRPRAEFAAATAMILVGVVYTLLLRGALNPQGWSKLADIALHDAMPVMMALFWLLRPHRLLRWRDVPLCAILPLGYFAYALARGAAEGWYPYGFMDVAQFGVGAVAVNCTAMGAAFLAMAAALKVLDRFLP